MLLIRRKRHKDIFIVIPGREKPIEISVNRFIDHPQFGMEVELSFECDDDIEIQRGEQRQAEDENRGNK